MRWDIVSVSENCSQQLWLNSSMGWGEMIQGTSCFYYTLCKKWQTIPKSSIRRLVKQMVVYLCSGILCNYKKLFINIKTSKMYYIKFIYWVLYMTWCLLYTKWENYICVYDCFMHRKLSVWGEKEIGHEGEGYREEDDEGEKRVKLLIVHIFFKVKPLWWNIYYWV